MAKDDMHPELQTSDNWSRRLRDGIIIYDPDGWDRKNYKHSWSEEYISQREFERRFMLSTVQMPNDGKGIWRYEADRGTK